MSATNELVPKLIEINDKLKLLSTSPEENAAAIGSTLDSLKAFNTVTPVDLKASQLNVIVAEFRKSPNVLISTAAKDIIAFWKSLAPPTSSPPVATAATSTPSTPASKLSANAVSQSTSEKDNELVQLPPPTELVTKPSATQSSDSQQQPKRSLVAPFVLGNASTPSRNAVQKHFFNCFDDSVETDFRTELAVQIELEVFKTFNGENQNYKDRIRMLLANLKDAQNPDFKEMLLSGAVSPAELPTMDQRSMASKAAQSRIAAEVDYEHQKRKTDSGDGDGKGVDMFPCPQCKGRNTSYFQKQTRSADEPMTIFCRCLICNKRWRIY